MVSEKARGFYPVSSSGMEISGSNATFGLRPSDGVEQRLVLQVADENMFFMFRQRPVVDAIAGNVNLFRAPEEGELLFNQLFKDVVFLLIVAGHVNRLAKNMGSSS